MVRCTECDGEMNEGSGICPSCGADPQDLVTVCRTGDAALLPILKSLLSSAGIPHVVQGEEALGLLPLGTFAVGIVGGRPAAASILVPRQRAEEAKRLIETPPKAES